MSFQWIKPGKYESQVRAWKGMQDQEPRGQKNKKRKAGNASMNLVLEVSSETRVMHDRVLRL